jgi:hypothetical protein
MWAWVHYLVKVPNRLGGSAIQKRSAALYFCWRQLFHMAGGGTVGLAAYLIGLYGPTVRLYITASFGAILAFCILLLEGTDGQKGQPKYKTFADLLFWYAGFILVFALTQ